MTPFKLILAATDFSAPANNAVRRAAMLARQHDTRLRIVHVINPARSLRFRAWAIPAMTLDLEAVGARESLRRLGAELTRRYDITVELEVRTGNTLEELHRTSTRADLLVFGNRRRNTLSELVLGRTAQRLVELCRRPVLVVKQVADSDYRKALVPVDFTPASDAAAYVAAALTPGVDLQIFHALDSTGVAVMREADVAESVIRDWRAKEESALMARMRRSMTRLGLDSRRMSFALGRGSPTRATLRQAQSLGADVLVVTKQRRAGFAASLLGDMNGLLARSRCDVLIVAGWVRDPRRFEDAAQQRPGSRTPGFGSLQPVRTARPSSRTRMPLAATTVPAGQRGRAASWWRTGDASAVLEQSGDRHDKPLLD